MTANSFMPQTDWSRLPDRFKLFLNSHASGDAKGAIAPDALQRTALALRRLCESCQKADVEVLLSKETVVLLSSLEKSAGQSDATIAGYVSSLKRYAFETGEGLDWATSLVDTRSIEQIIRHSWWHGWRDDLRNVPETAHRRSKILSLDLWLRRSCDQGQTIEVMRNCIAGSKVRAKQLRNILRHLAPESRDTALVEQVMLDIWPPKTTKMSPEERSENRRRVREARLDVSQTIPGRFRGTAHKLLNPAILPESYQPLVVSTLEAFFDFTAMQDLPGDFCRKTIVAYLDWLDVSDDTPGTRFTRVRILETLAREMGYAFEIVDGFETRLYASVIG